MGKGAAEKSDTPTRRLSLAPTYPLMEGRVRRFKRALTSYMSVAFA